MSLAALAMKKQQVKDYFLYHPDSQEAQLETFPFESFPVLFDFGYASGDKDSGNVRQQKKDPHITFFADYADGLVPHETKLSFANNSERVFTVVQVRKDETDGTYQGEAWLV